MAVISGNTIRHIAVVLHTVIEVRRTGLAALRVVIHYKTASVPRKGILDDREAISVASVIEPEIEEAPAIAVVLLTVIGVRRTGLAARREVILYRTASERRKEILDDKAGISGATIARAIVVVLAIEVELATEAIEVASAIAMVWVIVAVSAIAAALVIGVVSAIAVALEIAGIVAASAIAMV